MDQKKRSCRHEGSAMKKSLDHVLGLVKDNPRSSKRNLEKISPTLSKGTFGYYLNILRHHGLVKVEYEKWHQGAAPRGLWSKV